MLSMAFWIAFGATTGLVAAILQNEKETRYVSGFILLGAAGGLAGGFIGGLLDPAVNGYHTSTTDIIFAIFGATAFVAGGNVAGRNYFKQRN